MKTRILSTMLMLCTLTMSAIAQKTATVKNFSLTTDHIAGVDRRSDLNGDPCALVKIQVVDGIERIEGNKIGNIIDKGVEKWVYMCKGSRNMRIHLKNHLPIKVMFQDYQINGLEGNRVYELIIKTEQQPVLIGQNVRLGLSNGSILIGKLEAFDVTKAVTINLAGISTSIPMNDISEIECNGNMVYQKEVQQPEIQQPDNNANESILESEADSVIDEDYGDVVVSQENSELIKVKVTETKNYPGSYNIKIGEESIRMVLVRGGSLRMGYDGKNSGYMKSKPVHEVNVTSFYISEDPVNAALVQKFLSQKAFDGKGDEPAEISKFENAKEFVLRFAQSTNKPYRLPTEAEWEYAACSEVKGQLFRIAQGKKLACEWCGDFFDEFPKTETVLTDPEGPSNGKYHVIRSYNRSPNKFNRNPNIPTSRLYKGLVRLVIKANQK